MKAAWNQVLAVARKELRAYFGSPMAFIFVGVFLIVTLFTFFWVDTFFARNIADVRPLFRWMPVLMIFLVAALTMRQWSEEQRAGTLEVLMTLPVRPAVLVLGKFLATMALVALAVALTIFLPITVSILGDLDWGPVIGGYLATLLMAGAYAAIGLFISSRTDNQIVSLLLTLLVGGAFYLVGSPGVTKLFGETPAEILRAIGTGSRFESIERGVIDLRDLVYYLSLTAFFLVANVVSLESKRWSQGPRSRPHRLNALLRILLVGANVLALNAWMFPLHGLRADITAGREYSLSQVTRDLIRGLEEPLLIRGYFSERTHPLLSPLIPTIRDMLQEYEIASGGRIKVEIIDPRSNSELEAEANQLYGIRPTPFRIAGRYEDTIISSYFDILVRYGDQYEVLGFDNLIEIRPAGGGEWEVGLRNLEYDLTRAIKRVVYGFQSLDALFAKIEQPIRLTLYATPDTLPTELKDIPGLVEKVARDIEKTAGGKFIFTMVNPRDPQAGVSAEELYSTYGIRPFAVSLFSDQTYYLHVVMQAGEDISVMYPTGSMTEADVRSEIEAGIKRAAPGFLKTVGIWHPSEEPVPNMFGGYSQPVSTWSLVRDQLSQEYNLKSVDLSAGRVPGDVDVLVIIGPYQFTDKELYAVDQYLMRGGAVIVAGGRYRLSPVQFGGAILMEPVKDRLFEMLAHYGVTVGEGMVLDPQNEPFPIQVARTVSGVNVVEIQQLRYPYFVDVRASGMAKNHPIVANLPAVTLQWVSPLEVDPEKNKEREVVELLRSTDASWVRTTNDVQPNMQAYPELGFPVEGEQKSRLLAVSIRGSFESYFKDRPNPFLEAGAAQEGENAGTAQESDKSLGMTTVEKSPESARLVVIGSSEFLDDAVLSISRTLFQDRYRNNLQFLQNAVDWAVEDADLLSIRSRGTQARLLRPLSQGEQSFWEGLNYVVALLGLGAIGLVWNNRRRHEAPMPLVNLHPSGKEQGGES